MAKHLGIVHKSIESSLRLRFAPTFLQVINESSSHNVAKNSETHFKVVVVSAHFDGIRLLERHRLVHDALASQLRGPVHALSITAKTPAQWDGSIRKSPPCLGGSSK